MIIPYKVQCVFKSILHRPKKTQASAINITPLDPIGFEKDWIQGLREQVEFADADMRYHSISLRVIQRELIEGDAIN